MDLAFNNLQRLIRYKTQQINQPNHYEVQFRDIHDETERQKKIIKMVRLEKLVQSEMKKM